MAHILPSHQHYRRHDYAVTFVDHCKKGISLSVLALQPLFPPDIMPWGLLCKAVDEGGRAQQLGLRPGDVIKTANGVALQRMRDETAQK